MTQETSNPFDGLDPDLRQRLVSQAVTITERLLRHLSQGRPVRFRSEVTFQRGTMEFALLHRFAMDTAAVVALLNEALATLSPGAQVLRFSPIDPALCQSYDGYLGVMLHPVEMNTAELTEVPPSLRIFQINSRQPYDIVESPVFGTKHISYAREQAADPLVTLRQHWRADREALGSRLLEWLRTKRRDAELPPRVLDAVDDLLTKAMGLPGYYLMDLLEAASYMGLVRDALQKLAEG